MSRHHRRRLLVRISPGAIEPRFSPLLATLGDGRDIFEPDNERTKRTPAHGRNTFLTDGKELER